MDRTRVLVVDDDQDILDFVSLRVNQAGLATDSAASAEDALALMRRNLYWVVVADIHMPGMNGIELISALKTINPLTHIIMCTSDASLARVVECIGRGAMEFFSKGDDPRLLVDTVNAAVQRTERWLDWLGGRGWAGVPEVASAC